jgi:GNAT superfamily N-acetyltransferase
LPVAPSSRIGAEKLYFPQGFYSSLAMLHLAQVKQRNPEGKVMIQLLAQQKAEYAWAVLDADDSQLWIEGDDYGEGTLLLVDLSPTKQVQDIHHAAQWILEVIDQYLSLGITPAILHEEVQRAEQWRQSLTLQSQELGRRALEIEARRDQIQELEENLKQEKQALDTITAQLKADAKLQADLASSNLTETNGSTELSPEE